MQAVEQSTWQLILIAVEKLHASGGDFRSDEIIKEEAERVVIKKKLHIEIENAEYQKDVVKAINSGKKIPEKKNQHGNPAT